MPDKKPLYWSEVGNSHCWKGVDIFLWWSTLTGFYGLCTHYLMLGPENPPTFSSSLAFITGIEMGQGIQYYRNYRSAPAVSMRMHWRATGGARAVSGLACSQLLQACLWRASSRADRQTTTSYFQGKPLFCFQSPITHAILPVSTFVCPLFMWWHLTYSSSKPPQEAFSCESVIFT